MEPKNQPSKFAAPVRAVLHPQRRPPGPLPNGGTPGSQFRRPGGGGPANDYAYVKSNIVVDGQTLDDAVAAVANSKKEPVSKLRAGDFESANGVSRLFQRFCVSSIGFVSV